MRNEYILVLLGVEFRWKNHLENLSIDGSVRNHKKLGHKDADWINEAQDGDPITDCCEQGNEHSDCNNYAQISWHN
jgi:hypothetical protein